MKKKTIINRNAIDRRKFIKSTGLLATGIWLTGTPSLSGGTDTGRSFYIGDPVVRRSSFRLAAFRADATPPPGSSLCAGLVKPVEGITDPLLALGVVILSDEKPIVICAFDWCEIHNADHLLWRERFAEAAGTTPDRVSVHSIHQHNAPIADTLAEKLMAESPSPVSIYDSKWGLGVIGNVSHEISAAMKKAKPVSHISFGEARVSQVASNRRVMGPDGRVAYTRTSATKDAKVRDMPEGLIDPMLKTVSFWNGTRKLAALHYYATHPMSYYGDGLVTYDFAGIAREKRTIEERVPHIYFNGCGGNITAGKYNDGDKANRPVLAERIHSAMIESESNTKLIPAGTIEWKTRPLILEPDTNPEFSEERMLKIIMDGKNRPAERIEAALRVSFIRFWAARKPIVLSSLSFDKAVRLLNLPAESFVEYQLFAQQMAPGSFVATAAYEDTGAEYIPLEKSFAEGGYEPTWAFARPDTEIKMKDIIRELLGT
jgi:hypothetical protein